MSDNPYEAPRAERCEARPNAGQAPNTVQYGLLDARVMAVASGLVALAVGLLIAMAAVATSLGGW
jgi:hypothetical protein